MPRPPKVKSPIRDLRTIIGITQRELAFSIGISRITLTRIENGTLKLSQRVARKIVYATAVNFRCLTGKLRPLRNVDGERYTKDFYKAWKDDYSWQDENAPKRFAERLRLPMEILLQASAIGSRKRLRLVVAEIEETLERCRVDFNLQQPINEILAKPGSLPFISNGPLKWKDLMLGHGEVFWGLVQAKHDYPNAFKSKSKRPSMKRRRR